MELKTVEEILRAFANKKEVEYWDLSKEWKTLSLKEFGYGLSNDSVFSNPDYKFRIKPEKKRAPLTREDFEDGNLWWVKKHLPSTEVALVTLFNADFVHTVSTGSVPYSYISVHCLRATSPKGPWLPCYKDVEE